VFVVDWIRDGGDVFGLVGGRSGGDVWLGDRLLWLDSDRDIGRRLRRGDSLFFYYDELLHDHGDRYSNL
jgi:hypothetical protein